MEALHSYFHTHFSSIQSTSPNQSGCFTFCSIAAEPEHLQKWLRYPENRLDPRISKMPENPDFRIRFARKSGFSASTSPNPYGCFTFCSIAAEPEHLQKWLRYPENRLDPRISKMPENPDFRIRFARKSGFSGFHYNLNCGSSRTLTEMVQVPREPSCPKDSKNAQQSGFPDREIRKKPEKRKNSMDV